MNRTLNNALILVAGASLTWGCSSDEDDSSVDGSGGNVAAGSASAGVGGAGAAPGAGGVSGGVGGGLGSGGLSNTGVGGGTSTGGGIGAGGSFASGGALGAGGGFASGGALGAGGGFASGGSGAGGGDTGAGGSEQVDCTDTGADSKMSFFVSSWFHMDMIAQELGRGDVGLGGDLRYPEGETDGLKGADNLCQEMASRVCHGHKTWKAYLSTSSVDAKDHIEGGPWYDFMGNKVADDIASLLASDGECDGVSGGAFPGGGDSNSGRLASSICGTYDETGQIHDGQSDIDGEGGSDDDDHDVMTATDADGTYRGFSCEDWTSVEAESSEGIGMGHSWPAFSGVSWSTVHAGHNCKAGVYFGTNNSPGAGLTVGDGGGYGGIYCFASTSE